MAEHRTITQAVLASLKPNGKDQFVRDSRLVGFAIRMNPKGKISYIVEGRVKRGPAVRIQIGTPELQSISQARERAAEPLRLMQQGIDPREHRRDQEKAKRQAKAHDEALSITLESVFNRYLEVRALRAKTVSVYKSAMRSYFSDWLPQPIRQITRPAVEQRFLELRANKGQASASMGFRVLSSLCNWARADVVDGEPLLRENPCDVLKQKRYDRSVKPRKSYLDEKQIDKLLHYAEVVRRWPTPELFTEINKDGVSAQVMNYVLLLLFTGLRKNEGLGLRWEDVDMTKRVFLARDTKNHSDHFIPMSFYVYRIFSDQLALAGDSPFVFPSERSDSGHMTETKKRLKKIVEASGVEFMLHDLRRTFASHAAIQGMEHAAIQRALNHKATGITAQYIQATVETLRPVFDAVARGYLTYFDPDLAREIYGPEAVAREAAEEFEQFKEIDNDFDPKF